MTQPSGRSGDAQHVPDAPDVPGEPGIGHDGVVTVSIVGSTGSIGTQTLDVVGEDPDRFRVVALGAQRSVDALVDQARALTTG